MNNNNILTSGHRACAGCGEMIAARAAARGMNKNVIIANATGCLEVTTTPYPETAWGVPWIHSLFENAAAIASGVRAALNQKPNKKYIKVIAQGGDGGTFDIGFGLISGMWERGEDILYIAYDTEAYSNTGIQASGATPLAANTTTTPAGTNSLGSKQVKKDMLAIALAHGLPYVAQSTAGFPNDITNKVKTAINIKGPSYIQILTPCIPGWKINPSQAMIMGKLAVETGLYPLLEYEDGQLINKSKAPKPKIKVEEYLKPQGRFSHLFKDVGGKEQIKLIQKLADANIKKYGL